MSESHVAYLNRNIHSESLFWSCKARLEFLTMLLIEEPDLVKHERCFTGFREAMVDCEQLLGLAIQKKSIEEESQEVK